MHGIVSLLDPQHYSQIEEIWQKLAEECGLTGVQVTPYPHFSWQVGAGYAEPQSEESIRAIAQEMQPFTVRTNGLGIFSGANPVVYIPIIRNPKLDRLHKKLWKQLKPHAKGSNLLYSPQNWMPHITLVFGDQNVQSILCGLGKLAFRSFDWEIEVNNLSLVSQSERQIGILEYRHDFQPK